MKEELKGTIKELFEENCGIILGEDNSEYYFWKIDLIEDFKIEKNIKIKFKPEQYITEKETLYKATFITKDEETII